jgi:DNA-binding CsgD family transcriptional regulator
MAMVDKRSRARNCRIRRPGVSTAPTVPATNRHRTPPGRRLKRRWPVIDELDQNIVVIDGTRRMLLANDGARKTLRSRHLCAGRQRVSAVAGVLAPRATVRGAAELAAHAGADHGGSQVHVAVVPLAAAQAALLLGRQAMCEPLSLQAFAREAFLSPAETDLLEVLCEGLEPSEAAQRQGVALSTVRTHIAAIRAKPGVSSVRSLILEMAKLPPIMHALRPRDTD